MPIGNLELPENMELECLAWTSAAGLAEGFVKCFPFVDPDLLCSRKAAEPRNSHAVETFAGLHWS